MKILISTLLFLLSFTIGNAQQKTFASKDKSFTIIYPDSWTLLDKEVMPILEFGALAPRENENDDFSENVNVVIDSTKLAEKDLEEYYKASLNSMKPYLQNFKFETQGVDSTNQKINAKYFIYTHKSGKFNLRVFTFMCKSNGRVYVVTCSAETNNFKGYKPTFLSICRSISFN